MQQSWRLQKKKMENKGLPCGILNGVDEGSWWIGRVQKIRRHFGSKWGACRQPGDLLNRSANIQRKGILTPSIMVLLT